MPSPCARPHAPPALNPSRLHPSRHPPCRPKPAPTPSSTSQTAWQPTWQPILPFYDDSPESLDDALADFAHYAVVYVAAECLAGRDPSPTGFREMVSRTFTAGRDRIPRIAAEAQTVIAAVLARDPWHAPPPCLRPYVTPTTAVEAISALRLTRPIIAVNRPDLQPWQIDAITREIALAWFGRPEALHQWACSHDHTCTLPTPPSTRPTRAA